MKNKFFEGNFSIFLVAEAITLIICCLFSFSPLFSIISVASFSLWIIYLWIVFRGLFIKYFPILFIVLATVLGITIIEFDEVTLTNLQAVTSYKGSLPLLVLSNWVLIVSIGYFDRISKIRSRDKIKRWEIDHHLATDKSRKQIVKIITIVSLIINLYLWFRVIRFPAFAMRIDRFTYERTVGYRNNLGGVLTAISGYLIVFSLASIKYGYKKIGIASISSYFLYSLWIGNKFGTFFIVFCTILLFFCEKITYLIERHLKYITISLIAIIVLIFSAVMLQTRISTSFTPIQYLKWRISTEGEIWWKIYDLFDCKPHLLEFPNEILAVFNGRGDIAQNVGSNNGIYKMMYLCAPTNQVDKVIASGSRYCSAGFAAMNYYFGPIGPIVFAIIMGYVFSKTTNRILYDINCERFIRVVILVRFLTIEREILDQFVFNQLVEIASVASIIFLLISSSKSIYFVANKKRLLKI